MNRLMIAALLLAASAAGAQDQLATPTAATPAAPATTPAASAPSVSLEKAYKKEYAFLEAQKRELGARIAQVRTQFQRERERLDAEVGQFENAALAARSETESLNDQVVRAEQAALASADNADMLSATFDQARSTLESFGDTTMASDAFVQQDEGTRLATLFDVAAKKLAELGQVRRETGRYFLANGTEVEGTIVRYGNIAAFGASPQGSGALAPAGGGRFKLWNAPAQATATALAQGQQPATLQAYLFENARVAAVEPQAKTFWGEMEKGGVIGYVIMALGLVALILVALRAVFLQRAGASITKIIDAVAPQVRAHRIEDAIAAAKRFKGSAARVVTAALRNLDRDREHLEDIVGEAILHESSHLNRFAGIITMIAAVAPLLGLLGTVTGMIQTFDVITEFGTSDPKLLSGGIATALVTTEQGLIVAIPCLLLGNLLGGWADRIKDDMEKAALKVVNLYQDVRLKSVPPSPARAAA